MGCEGHPEGAAAAAAFPSQANSMVIKMVVKLMHSEAVMALVGMMM